MITALGSFCIFCYVISVLGGYGLYSMGNVEGSRWAALTACLYLIAAAICFK